jgi:hypothetical protein
MIDAFAQSQGIPLTTHYFKALFGEGLPPFLHEMQLLVFCDACS